MGKKKTKSKRAGIRNIRQEQLEQGIAICAAHPLFGRMGGCTRIRDNQTLGKNNAAMVTGRGEILVNQDMSLPPKQWAYVIAHCKLHLAFGHLRPNGLSGKSFIYAAYGHSERDFTPINTPFFCIY